MTKGISIQTKPTSFNISQNGWKVVGPAVSTKQTAIASSRRIIEVNQINPRDIAVQKVPVVALKNGIHRTLKRTNWRILIRT